VRFATLKLELKYFTFQTKSYFLIRSCPLLGWVSTSCFARRSCMERLNVYLFHIPKSITAILWNIQHFVKVVEVVGC